MTSGIYKHPYKRGFAIEAVCEGFLSLSALVWKWEVWANVHGVGPGVDFVRKQFDGKIDAANKKANEAEGRITKSTWGDY